jgi:glucosyl-dolichyl phosphate glucuronosyltransferase
MKRDFKISLVICTYNREKFLPVALKSLTAITTDKNIFEIVLINNNSTDSTETICNEFIRNNQELQTQYHVETQRGLSAARNRGIKESRSELISFLDDDAEVTPEYVDIALNFFASNPNIDAMGGKIIPIYETGEEPKWLSKSLWGLVTKVDWGNKTRKYPYSKYPAGASMVFRKKVFAEIGLFNTELFLRSDDKFIFRRMEEKGKLFLYYPKFIAYHHIDAFRVTFESVKKISLIVGASERVRLQNAGITKNTNKIVEYILKLAAAIIIAIGFLFKLEFEKAEYIIKNRWLTLLGYFNTKL